MNANGNKITWCLNWGEDAISGWSACYCVSPEQERDRRKLRDGTNAVTYRLHTYQRGVGASEQLFGTFSNAVNAMENFRKML